MFRIFPRVVTNHSRYLRTLKTVTTSCSAHFHSVFYDMESEIVVSSSDGKKPFTIVVEGNIGSGKSTFLKHFCSSLYIDVISEPLSEWRNTGGHNLLEMMYENIHRHGFLAQSFLQLSRMKMHLQKSKKPIKLIERSIFSNRYCFTEMWRQNKTIRDAELCVLEEWFNWFEQNINLNVDLIVYLRTDPEVVYRRLLERNRKEEEGVPFEYLSELHTSYENWLVHRTVGKVPCPVITLDASKALEELKSDYQVVWKHAKEREWIIPVEEIAVGESA